MNPVEMLRILVEGVNEKARQHTWGEDYREKQLARDRMGMDNAIEQTKMRQIARSDAVLGRLARAKYPTLNPEQAIEQYQADQLQRKTQREEELSDVNLDLARAHADYYRKPPKPPTEKGVQHVTTKNGIFAFDPNTGTLGQKIADAPAPPPSFSFVTTADGIQPGNRRTGQLGAPVGQPRDPASVLQQKISLQKARAALSKVKELSAAIHTGEGFRATVGGAIQSGAASINQNQPMALYKSGIRGFASLLARAVGHTGVLTEQDVERTQALLGGPTDADSLRAQKLANFEQVISAMSGDEFEPTDSATDPGAFQRKLGQLGLDAPGVGTTAPNLGTGPGGGGSAGDPLGIFKQ